jgi:hypothetical protein
MEILTPHHVQIFPGKGTDIQRGVAKVFPAKNDKRKEVIR